MMQGLADEIVYIDIDKNKAVMQALDLDDMASNLDRDFTVRAGDYSDCADAHIVVMAAGKSRLPGQTRLDMFDDSIKMMNTIVGPLKESGFHGILISISNPADIIADFLRKDWNFQEIRCSAPEHLWIQQDFAECYLRLPA